MPRGIQMSMKIVLSILLAGIIILDSEAQTVTGRVIDSESAETLIGANVVTTSGPTKLGTATSANGRFTLSRLGSGRYTIQVSYVGYRSQDIVVDVRGGWPT